LKFLIILFLLFTISSAKVDFYYSFIDPAGTQISEKRKNDIKDGFELLQQIKKLAKNGKVDEAFAEIESFKATNKIDILNSDILLTYSEIALKKASKRIISEASNELELAINTGQINEDDLSKAYMLMVDFKLETNRVKEAKYFAEIIINNFSDKITNAYGQIYLAKVYKHTKSYSKAIKTLYNILVNTTDVLVATIVADELFDIYILDGQKEKAYELISKVLNKNIDYYSEDSYVALRKVDKLVDANMPEFAVEILKELLNRAKQEEFIEEFKFKLANVYMEMYDGTNYYLYKAKELYKDILTDYPNGLYANDAKMYIDEILMREGNITPQLIVSKYPNSEAMKQKALLQELLNFKKEKKYDFILKSKRVYGKIADTITKRFAYKNVGEIFDEVNVDLIKQYLKNDQCSLMNKALKTSRKETLELLIEDKNVKYNFFECLIEVPYERAYEMLKETFNTSRDATLYLYLERMAYSLGLVDDAMDFSSKVEMVNNKDVLAKEFLYRFLVYSAKKDSIAMEKFFYYATRFPEFITKNENNPLIIDFYYQYYLYLIGKDKQDEAENILNKLYTKQKEFDAYVYSPFVDIELAMIEKRKNNIPRAIEYLTDSIKNTRNMKANDQARVDYELIRLYDSEGLSALKNEFITKCKDIKNTKDSLYKAMCDKM
jgi:predicted negative regulator of RcsB-dependent stress response|tara:strand:+ start:735 stop:2729 length:1995 start_codon:yes stop_codon:yes gene_type:complete